MCPKHRLNNSNDAPENELQVSRAIGRIFALLIVLAVIASASAGYGLGQLTNQNATAPAITLTEQAVTSYIDNYSVIVSGTCTNAAGTVNVNVRTTTYMESMNATGYFNATIVTVTTHISSSTTRTVTLSSTTSTSGCPTYV